MKKTFQSETKIFELDAEKHHIFLDLQAVDKYSGKLFEAGDSVSVCKLCNEVLLASSLDSLNWQHCDGQVFSNFMPLMGEARDNLDVDTLEKPRRRTILKAWLADAFIFFQLHFMFLIPLHLFFSSFNITKSSMDSFIGEYSVLNPIFYLPIYILYFVKDSLFSGQSFGKRFAKIKVVHRVSQRNCGLFRAMFRTLLSPLHIFTPLLWLMKKDSLVDLLSNTTIVKWKGFFVESKK